MSKWTHSLCKECWHALFPKKFPFRLKAAYKDVCCRCGQTHNSGIFYRDDPQSLPCKGIHAKDE